MSESQGGAGGRDEGGGPREDQGLPDGAALPRRQASGRELQNEVEASETDGAGTGGVGQDAGGSGAVGEGF